MATLTAPEAGLARTPSPGSDGPPACQCLGETTPLPLEVKTPEDLAFKAMAERHYLIVNLLTAGRAAWQRDDIVTAIDRWQRLLLVEGLSPEIEAEVEPLLAEARSKAGRMGLTSVALPEAPPEKVASTSESRGIRRARTSRARPRTVAVSGRVHGGGSRGPGGTVVWLEAIDHPTPRPAPGPVKTIRQRNKTFYPHVLAVPVGGRVAFVNEDEIHHNVFSLTQKNDFDSGLYKRGGHFTRTFKTPGAVEILCNIHATMSAYVYVVNSPYYAVASQRGHFRINNVPPGRYRLTAWHEGTREPVSQVVKVGGEGPTSVMVAIAGDRGSRPPAPDKYGRPRQEHIGY